MKGLEELVEHAVGAAFAAGREILAVYGSAFSVQEKEDRSPLTEADMRAHRVITEHLAATGLPVLSEEGRTMPVEERQAWSRYWLVDPLDGTKEFVKRNGEFTVNIALMEPDGLPEGPLGTSRPVAGVLYAPVLDVLYFAWKGAGAYRQTAAATSQAVPAYQRAAMAERLPIPQDRDAFTIVSSRSHRSVETNAYIERMQKEHGDVALATKGSALKFGLVAEGTADAYPRYAPTMEWDSAAGDAICTEAGKVVIDLTTHAPIRYNKSELVNNWFIVQ